jgi:hypothetical protein
MVKKYVLALKKKEGNGEEEEVEDG